MDGRQIYHLLVGASVFALVLSAWGAVLLLWWIRRSSWQERIQHRLDLFNRPSGTGDARVLRLWRDGKEATTVVPGAVPRPTMLMRFEEMRQTAGIQAPLATLGLGAVGLAAGGGALGLLLTSKLIVAFAAGVVILVVCWVAFQQRVNGRISAFETQLVDALELAARSLRAGHPLSGAFRLIAEEVPAPIGLIFAQINQEQNLGVGLTDALRNAANATTSPDLKLFATSVVIQMRTGGNLADMMERLALVIRDRMRLTRRVRVLTAQTQFSKWVLLALPFFLFVVLMFLNPEYMKPLYTEPWGQVALGIAVLLVIVGAAAMNWLAKIKY